MADKDISFKGKKGLLDHSSLTCIIQARKFHLVTPVELTDLLIYSRREFGSPLFERSVDFLPRREDFMRRLQHLIQYLICKRHLEF